MQRKRDGSDLTSKKRVKMNTWQRDEGRFQSTGPMYWKDLSPRVLLPILGTRKDASIRGWAKRTRRRVEMKQLKEIWRSCTRINVEADESYFVLNPVASRDRKEKYLTWADSGTFKKEASWAVDHCLNFIFWVLFEWSALGGGGGGTTTTTKQTTTQQQQHNNNNETKTKTKTKLSAGCVCYSVRLSQSITATWREEKKKKKKDTCCWKS